ncbi:MAG: hypothetical protein R3F59_37485 [Myxococcota bacterium]
MGRARTVVGGVLLLAALGCAGIWREAVSEQFSEMTVELDRAVATGAHNRDAVQDLIDDGWIAAWQGDIGLFGAIPFAIELDDVLLDGAIEDGEVALLREKGKDFRANLPDPDRRRELLAIKAVKDDHKRAEMGDAPAGDDDGASRSPVEAWALPDGLRSGLTGAGWTVTRCADGSEDDVRWAQCDAENGALFGSVTVERYATAAAARDQEDGSTVRAFGDTLLDVEVTDPSAAEGLLDAIIGGRRDLDLAESDLRKLASDAGWPVTGCESEGAGEERTSSCTLAKAGREGDAFVVLITAPGRGAVARSSDDGVAWARAGASSLSVSVDDPAAARALLADLTR